MPGAFYRLIVSTSSQWGGVWLDKVSFYHFRIRQKPLTTIVNLFGLCLEN